MSCLGSAPADDLIVDVELDLRSKYGLSSIKLFPLPAKLPYKLEPGATDNGDLPQLLSCSRALLHCHARSGSPLPSLLSKPSVFGGGSGGGGEGFLALGMDMAKDARDGEGPEAYELDLLELR